MYAELEEYTSVDDYKKKLSYDPVALTALVKACSGRWSRGAWNLLLIGAERLLIGYASRGAESDALLVWLAEGVKKGINPFSYIRYTLKNRIASEKSSEARIGEYLETLDLESAYEGEQRILSDNPRHSDPFLARRITRALLELSQRQRECLLLSFEGYGESEIAEILGITPKAAKKALYLARNSLRGLFPDRLA